jgi:hypothetical protein
VNPVHVTTENSVNTVDVTLVLDDRKESEAHKGNQGLIKGRSYPNKVIENQENQQNGKPRKQQKNNKTTKSKIKKRKQEEEVSSEVSSCK